MGCKQVCTEKRNCQKKEIWIERGLKVKEAARGTAQKYSCSHVLGKDGREDGVVRQQIQPLAVSALSRKIAAEPTESSSDESIDHKGEIPKGYCLFSVDSLKGIGTRIRLNTPCTSGKMHQLFDLHSQIYIMFVLFSSLFSS